jgi:hypothetical protein
MPRTPEIYRSAANLCQRFINNIEIRSRFGDRPVSRQEKVRISEQFWTARHRLTSRPAASALTIGETQTPGPLRSCEPSLCWRAGGANREPFRGSCRSSSLLSEPGTSHRCRNAVAPGVKPNQGFSTITAASALRSRRWSASSAARSAGVERFTLWPTPASCAVNAGS